MRVLATVSLCVLLSACATRQGVPTTSEPREESFELAATGTRPTQIKAKAGDTVYGLAYKYGITSRALIAANNLTPPYTLKKGKKLKLPNPNEHVVIDGDTLESIADFYAVDVKVLGRENNLDEPYDLEVGSTLIIPNRDTVDLVEGIVPEPTVVASASLKPLDLPKKDSSANIPDDLKAELAAEIAGGLDREEIVEEMHHDTDPLGDEPAVAEEVEEIEEEIKPEPKKAAPKPPSKVQEAEESDDHPKAKKLKSEKSEEGDKSSKDKKDTKEGKAVKDVKETKKESTVAFGWPLNGDVLNKFGASSGGARNDGIKIGVPENTTVKASADGQVVYSGNELKGFGNLVLVKHAGGWITAYANNTKLLVVKGDKVRRGQAIAKSGTKLHFEIRKGTQPIDPLSKLGS